MCTSPCRHLLKLIAHDCTARAGSPPCNMMLTCACAPYAVRLSEEGMAAWLQLAQMSHAIKTPARNQLQVSACSMQATFDLTAGSAHRHAGRAPPACSMFASCLGILKYPKHNGCSAQCWLLTVARRAVLRFHAVQCQNTHATCVHRLLIPC